MKKLLLYLLLLFCGTASAQLQQVWKTDYQISSDTFQTFGYKTDSAGNFYLYGWQHNKVFLQKHNAEGQIEWTINDNSIIEPTKYIIDSDTFEQPILNTRITDLIINGEESIYVVGIQSVDKLLNLESYVFVSNILPNREVKWKHNFSLSYSLTRITPWNHNAIALFNSLEKTIYLAHSRQNFYCNSQYNTDFGLIKCDSAGRFIWSQWLVGNSSYCTKDIITSLFIQDSGIGFSGFTTSPDPNLSKLVTVKLDKDGNLINRAEEKQFIADSYSDRWNNLYLTDTFTTKGLTKGNTTYITAESADSIRTEQRNLLVLKYDETLNRIWRYDLEKDSFINLKIEKSVVDDSCNLLVSGIWKEHGEHKAFFVKLDSSGNERYRDTFSSNVEVNLNVLNKHQQSVLLTTSLSGSAYNTSIRKFHASGDVWWNQPLLFPGKILHAFLDSCYLYLVIQNEKTVSYVKLRDTTCKDDPFLILKNQSLTQNSVSMGWSFNDTFSARKGFVIERSLDGLLFNTIDSVHSDTAQYTNINLSPNTLYHYRVGAYNDAGVYLLSNIINAQTLLNTANNPAPAPLIIYPNPTTGLIYLQNIPKSTLSCRVYDITGRMLIEATQVEQNIDISSLKQGVYILRLSDAINQNYVFKILKE